MSFEIGIGPNIRKSVYFDATVADGVRGFSVYNHMLIPSHFGDPDAEYHSLMTGVAMWDVAAQRQVEITGPDATDLVQYLTPRDIGTTEVGQGRYVPLCDHEGHLINDPVLLRLGNDRYWLSIADSDIELWARAIARERGLDADVSEPDVSPLAIQGPRAEDVVADLFGTWIRDIRHFGFRQTELNGIPLVLARSGWSKQGGFELYLQAGPQGAALWTYVKEAGRSYGIRPGAPNDVERIESGLVSYGADGRLQSNPCNPFEIGLGAFVDFDKPHDFIGKAALQKIKSRGVRRQRIGFIIDGPPLCSFQHALPVHSAEGSQAGLLSEAVFSRRFSANLGVGMMSVDHLKEASPYRVAIDGQDRDVRVRALPFDTPL